MNGKSMTGMGLACGACCALPMLLAAGALSLGTAAFAGIAAGGTLAVAATAYLVVRGRAPKLPGVALLATFALGLAVSAWGLIEIAEAPSRSASGAVTGGLALLACVALLRLPDERRHSAG